MGDQNWRALKRIVDSDDFVPPPGFETSLITPLKKAIAVKVAELCSKTDSEFFSLQWFQEFCERLGARAHGQKRESYLKDALLKLYQLRQDETFWREVQSKREQVEKATRKEKSDLEHFYFDLRDSAQDEKLMKLVAYFYPDEKVEDRLKVFRKQFGIKAGGSKRTKLQTRLKSIAKEIVEREGGHGFH